MHSLSPLTAGHSLNGFKPLADEVFVLPATVGQHGFLYLDQLQPGNPAYNIAIRFRLQGRLRAEELERALNEIVRRHESLRTVFAQENGVPVQLVSPQLSIRMRRDDLEGVSEEDRDEQARAIATEEGHRRFDLTKGPLIRARLLRLDDEEHILLVTTHHIVSDGWSLGILAQELRALYEAFCRGLDSPLPDLALQWGDFAVWQEQWLKSKNLNDQIEYWARQLADLTPLELPTDRPRPPVQTFNGNIESILLPRELTDCLESLCSREKVTLFVLTLAAFKLLLHRYSGQNDVFVGSVLAGRSRVELEPLIGLFINPLVLRTNLSGDPTFLELLARVRETVLEGFANHDVPFERVVKAVQPERDPSRHPIFQINFLFQRAFLQPFEAAGVTFTAIPSLSPGAICDLNFFLVERAEGWRASCEYNVDLYESATVRRLLGHFQTLLEGIAANPVRRISDFPLLTQEERELLASWNQTTADYPRTACVHELFEAQAERTPDALAIVFGKEQWTYRELNTRANQLAHYLRDLGLGPETLVGLYLERSPALIMGLLAVLKAGGAYVPLDLSYPKSHVAFMLEDSRAPIVLTCQHLAASLPPSAGRHVLLDADAAVIARHSTDNLNRIAAPDNVAYLIYTSGSTGKPKGAMILHRGLVNYLNWATEAYAAAAGTGAPFHSPLGFDLSVTSLFPPLLAGRIVYILSEAEGVEALGTTLRRQSGFSLIKLTPSHLEVLSRIVPAAEAAGRTGAFVIGGEALRAEDLEFWRQHAPGSRLINEYGPTETVVGCCVYEVSDDTLATGPVPIGRPISNTRLHVLDEHMQLRPIGVAGELYIGGAGVCRGYWRRPELTAAKFIPDPFSEDPGALLYRTGDRVRWRADGNLEFLGRLDDQVKLRGFRVELGEIETALGEHPQVRQAVVQLREDRADDKRLVACVVPRGEAEVAPAELRRFLGQNLPEYMVPSAFVVLDALPLTPNGKVDRIALPAPAKAESNDGESHTAPRNETESRLTELWEEALGEMCTSVTADFFEAGGNSLLAMRLLERIGREFDKRISLATFLLAPTIQAIAATLREEKWVDPQTQVFPMRLEGEKPPLILVDAGPFARPLVRSLGSDQPVFGVALPKLSSLPRQFTVQDVATNLVDALCTSPVEPPYYLAGWSHAGIIAYEAAAQLHARGKEVASLILFDTNSPSYVRSFKGWRNFPVRSYILLKKWLYHLRKLRGMPLRTAWRLIRERTRRFQLPK
jgi:amino acid adenylation domain-containing protein